MILGQTARSMKGRLTFPGQSKLKSGKLSTDPGDERKSVTMIVPNLRIKIGPALALLVALLALPAYAESPAAAAAISGVVRDAKGAPQGRALVELLGPDLG